MFLRIGKQLVNLDNVASVNLSEGSAENVSFTFIGDVEWNVFRGAEAAALRDFFDRAALATRTINIGSHAGPVVVNVPVPEP